MLKNLSIRYKLLLGFFLIIIVFSSFVSYFLVRLIRLDTSLRNVNERAKELQLFLRLDNDSKQLSYAIKSYMITGNSRWESVYDTTSSDLSTVLQTLKPLIDPDKAVTLTKFETIMTKSQGTELLILAKTKEGDKQKAISLFDNNYDTQQTQSLAFIAALVKQENTDFFILLQQDEALLTTIQNLFIGTVGFVLFIIIAIAIAISSVIETSFKTLIQNVNKIAGGNLQTRIPITEHDEIRNLGIAFNTMAERLQESYTGLGQQVQQRTQELEQTKQSLEQQVQMRTQELQKAKETLEQTVAERTKNLEDQLTQVKKMNDVMVDRELKMIALKKQIKQLESEKNNG